MGHPSAFPLITGISHRSTHTLLRIRGRRCRRVEPPRHLGGASQPSNLMHDFPAHPPQDNYLSTPRRVGVIDVPPPRAPTLYCCSVAERTEESFNKRRNKQYFDDITALNLSTLLDFNKHSSSCPFPSTQDYVYYLLASLTRGLTLCGGLLY